MKPPEDGASKESRGAEERLRQHLQARLPAEEVEEALRKLQLEPMGDSASPESPLDADDTEMQRRSSEDTEDTESAHGREGQGSI